MSILLIGKALLKKSIGTLKFQMPFLLLWRILRNLYLVDKKLSIDIRYCCEKSKMPKKIHISLAVCISADCILLTLYYMSYT